MAAVAQQLQQPCARLQHGWLTQCPATGGTSEVDSHPSRQTCCFFLCLLLLL